MKFQPYMTVFAHSTNMGVLHAMMRNLKTIAICPTMLCLRPFSWRLRLRDTLILSVAGQFRAGKI